MKLLYRHLAPLFFASFSLAAHAEGGGAQPKVKLSTNHGDIVIALNADKAPETVKNFIQYVESGFYDGTIFHRVIENFMIQGGGFDESFKQKKTEASIQNEADNGLSNKKGTVGQVIRILLRHSFLLIPKTMTFWIIAIKPCRTGVMLCLVKSLKVWMWSMRFAK